MGSRRNQRRSKAGQGQQGQPAKAAPAAAEIAANPVAHSNGNGNGGSQTNGNGSTHPVVLALNQPAARQHTPVVASGGKAKSKDALSLTRKAKEPREAIARLVDGVERDYQFQLGYDTLSSVVESVSVTFESNSDDPAVQAVIDNLAAQFDAIRSDALRAIAYGRAAFEKVLSLSRRHGVYMVKDLLALPFEETEMLLDDGEFAGIKVGKGETTGKDAPAVALKPSESWWFALDPTLKHPHGQSRYLGAAEEVWKDRKWLAKQDDEWVGRFSIGQLVARAPKDAPGKGVSGKGDIGEVDRAGQPINPIEQLVNTVLDALAGGVIGLDSARDETGPLYDISALQVPHDAASLMERRRYLDVAALRALGIPELSVMQTEVGSYSMSQVHLEVLYRNTDKIMRQLATSFQEHVINPLCLVNWSNGTKIWIVAERLSERLKVAAIYLEIVKAALVSGVVSPMLAAIDFEKLIEFVGLPLAEGSREKIEKAIEAASQKPPALPGGGGLPFRLVPFAAGGWNPGGDNGASWNDNGNNEVAAALSLSLGLIEKLTRRRKRKQEKQAQPQPQHPQGKCNCGKTPCECVEMASGCGTGAGGFAPGNTCGAGGGGGGPKGSRGSKSKTAKSDKPDKPKPEKAASASGKIKEGTHVSKFHGDKKEAAAMLDQIDEIDATHDGGVSKFLEKHPLKSVNVGSTARMGTSSGLYQPNDQKLTVLSLKKSSDPHFFEPGSAVSVDFGQKFEGIDALKAQQKATFTHELGHHIAMTAINKMPGGQAAVYRDSIIKTFQADSNPISAYASTHPHEYFAESFAAYHLDRSRLSPEASKMVEDVMKFVGG